MASFSSVILCKEVEQLWFLLSFSMSGPDMHTIKQFGYFTIEFSSFGSLVLVLNYSLCFSVIFKEQVIFTYIYIYI